MSSRRYAARRRAPTFTATPRSAGCPRSARRSRSATATVYGVELDPHREVAIVPGTKTAIVELALALAQRGDTILLPDPHYPDYPSGVALAGAKLDFMPLDPAAGWTPDFDAAPAAAAAFVNFPSNPCAAARTARASSPPPSSTRDRTGTAIIHDAAYIDLVFDGRAPAELPRAGGREGRRRRAVDDVEDATAWRAGGSASSSATPRSSSVRTCSADHTRVGIFAPLQEAAIAALTGPQDSVEARRASYERRRDRLVAALPEPPVCEGTFYVWLRLPDGLTAERLLLEHRVAVAPGEGFGASGAGWARLSLAVSDETLERGIERLAPVLAAAYA